MVLSIRRLLTAVFALGGLALAVPVDDAAAPVLRDAHVLEKRQTILVTQTSAAVVFQTSTLGVAPSKTSAAATTASSATRAPSSSNTGTAAKTPTVSPSESRSAGSLPTATSSDAASSSNGSSSGGGLSGGAIAGIVIGAIAAILIVGLLVFFLRRRKNKQKGTASVVTTHQQNAQPWEYQPTPQKYPVVPAEGGSAVGGAAAAGSSQHAYSSYTQGYQQGYPVMSELDATGAETSAHRATQQSPHAGAVSPVPQQWTPGTEQVDGRNELPGSESATTATATNGAEFREYR